MAKKAKAPKAKKEKAPKPAKEKKAKGGKSKSGGGGFKAMMLQKGDKIAFGLGLLGMLYLCMGGLLSGESDPVTAEAVQKADAAAKKRLADSKGPPSDEAVRPADNKFPPERLALWAERPTIPPADFRLTRDFINPVPGSENLRSNPVIFAPIEPLAVPVRFAFKFPHMDKEWQTIYLAQEGLPNLEAVELEATTPEEKARLERAKKRRDQLRERNKGGAGKSFTGGNRGRGRGRNNNNNNPGQDFQAAARTGKGGGKIDLSAIPSPKPLRELKEDEFDKIAQMLYPARAVGIVAAFPYDTQIKEMIRALKGEEDPADLIGYFQGVEVQRRRIVDGAIPSDPEAGWEIATDDTSKLAFEFLGRMIIDWEEEFVPEQLRVIPRLILPLPRAQRGVYPEELLRQIPLPSIKDAQAKLDKLTADELKALEPPPLTFGEGDEFNPFGLGQETANPRDRRDDRGPRAPRFDRKAVLGQDSFLPDHVLVRFLDIDWFSDLFEPGATYQYRVRVVVNNPNYERIGEVADPYDASVPLLLGKWSEPTPPVIFGREEFLFADEQESEPRSRYRANEEKIPMQVHKWLEYLQRVGGSQAESFGAWWVDRILVARGEYIGIVEEKDMIGWSTAAVDPDTNTLGVGFPRKVTTDSLLTDSLLVDFEGGGKDKEFNMRAPGVRRERRPPPAEVLIVHPNGRMTARRYLNDKEIVDLRPDAGGRYSRWKTWTDRVRERFKEN